MLNPQAALRFLVVFTILGVIVLVVTLLRASNDFNTSGIDLSLGSDLDASGAVVFVPTTPPPRTLSPDEQQEVRRQLVLQKVLERTVMDIVMVTGFAEITDAAKLKGHPFFSDVHNGDFIVSTKARAILFRPSTDTIIADTGRGEVEERE